MNRVIKVDALKDELALDADAKLVDDALTTVELSGAKGVDSPRVGRNEASEGTKNQQQRCRTRRNSHQHNRPMYRSMVVKLAHVAQDRVGIESVMCLTSHAERTTKQTHVGTREIETVFYQEQKMRAYISATHVRRITAGARGFFLGRRLDLEKEHERSACSTRTTFCTHTPCRPRIFLTHFPCVAYRHRVWLKVFAVRMSCLPSHLLPSHVSSTVFAVPARSPRHFVPVCSFLAELFPIRKRRSSALPHERRGVWLPGRSHALHKAVMRTQRVRQDYFCRWIHDAYERSELR